MMFPMFPTRKEIVIEVTKLPPEEERAQLPTDDRERRPPDEKRDVPPHHRPEKRK